MPSTNIYQSSSWRIIPQCRNVDHLQYIPEKWSVDPLIRWKKAVNFRPLINFTVHAIISSSLKIDSTDPVIFLFLKKNPDNFPNVVPQPHVTPRDKNPAPSLPSQLRSCQTRCGFPDPDPSTCGDVEILGDRWRPGFIGKIWEDLDFSGPWWVEPVERRLKKLARSVVS